MDTEDGVGGGPVGTPKQQTDIILSGNAIRESTDENIDQVCPQSADCCSIFSTFGHLILQVNIMTQVITSTLDQSQNEVDIKGAMPKFCSII